MTDRELIQALRVCADFTPACFKCPMSGDEDCAANMKELAADRLEALLAENEHLREATKMVPRWRPISEPPEEYRDEYGESKCFLVCVENCGVPFRAVYDGEKWLDGWDELRLTHWCKLPEPPSNENSPTGQKG